MVRSDFAFFFFFLPRLVSVPPRETESTNGDSCGSCSSGLDELEVYSIVSFGTASKQEVGLVG